MDLLLAVLSLWFKKLARGSPFLFLNTTRATFAMENLSKGLICAQKGY